jgi:hypothetical protein
MKFGRLVLFILMLVASPAFGQNAGTVTNHAFAIGKGPGVTGYTSLLCGAGQLAVAQAGADPICRTVSGDWTLNAAGVSTLATVNANVGAFGSATNCVTLTVNAKGLITAASQTTCTPAINNVSGLGAGVATALAIATGSNAGSFVVYNGAAGTPSAIVLTNATGTAAGLTAGTANAVAVGGITGAGAGCITWLTTPSSANLRGCLTDETGTGLSYFQGGDIGTPSAGVATNFTGTAAGLTAGSFSAGSASNLTSGTLPAARTNGHMNGTATNDNAAAGEVGEYMTNGASPALTTAVSANCGQLTLTAGDWDVYASGIFSGAGATNTTNTILGINNVSATMPAFSAFQYFQFRDSAGITDFAYAPTVGPWRVSITGASQTWYCVAQAVFTVSTYTFQGALRARRVR